VPPILTRATVAFDGLGVVGSRVFSGLHQHFLLQQFQVWANLYQHENIGRKPKTTASCSISL